MSISRHHTEWLSLVEVSGPFLSLPVLMRVFPQGLDAHDPEHSRALRMAYEEWEDSQEKRHPDRAIHNAWIRFVLTETLGLPEEVIAEGQAIPQTLKATISEHGETLRPDLVITDPSATRPRLLIHTYPSGQHLEKTLPDKRWKASPATRMMELLHATDVRLGLVTNGEHWMLVDAPRGETTGYASWYAHLWFEEQVTLRAIRSLLGAHRFFGVPDNETLEAMLAESAAHQQEVTDQLGYQVRRAVEVVIQELDRADQDHGRELLGHVHETVLYEAALTVMMRLVFLFCAEERELLLLGDPLYDQHYAVSTLVAQLQESADMHGEEVLERRFDGWCRLLSAFRAVYAGVQHDRMKLPAYGGRLFDPDRFPFLEGRHPDTSWRNTRANPLPINNRTVLHLLRSLQYLELQGEARRLSFRALDIEQIGHVYEGLLDHTAKRADGPVLSLSGAKRKEPEIAVEELERLSGDGEAGPPAKLIEFLKEETGRSESALQKVLARNLEPEEVSRFRAACGNDDGLFQRVRPFAGLVRHDTFGRPVVVRQGSMYVTAGTDRRSSGTHYTPRSLTEPIVQYTLEPLVYVGPAEGKPKEEWKLRPAAELLDLKICDMACGSGAFLVQACRYLSERLLEAWEEAEREVSGEEASRVCHSERSEESQPHAPEILRSAQNDNAQPLTTNHSPLTITPFGEPATGAPGETLIPKDPDERMVFARRLVAQRCLYGVDKNPLAVEMAKLSLWLLTLAKDKPFEFLDHAIRCGDSLVGIKDLKQLECFNLDGKGESNRLILQFLPEHIRKAVELRRKIIERPAEKPEDAELQEQLLKQTWEEIERLKCAADLLIAAEFWSKTAKEKQSALTASSLKVAAHFHDSSVKQFRHEADLALRGDSPVTTNQSPTSPFHWALEFPEIIVERGGFDAFVCNPPFMGGQKISTQLGPHFRRHLMTQTERGTGGTADLCVYFFLRAGHLLRREGMFGMLATNTIAQGDTREVGLDRLTAEGLTIPRAVASRKWPGSANLEVAEVWIWRGDWAGRHELDGIETSGITASLARPGKVTGKPHRLLANAGKSFIGSYVLGMGFTLTLERADAFLKAHPQCRGVLYPYINGKELNSNPDQSPGRWVINFHDWPVDSDSAPEDYQGPVAADYPDCLDIVVANVKPDRLKLNRAIRRERWWQFGDRAPALWEATAALRRVLAKSAVGERLSFEFVPSGWVYSHALVVFATESTHDLAVLQSTVHEYWARQNGSSMRTDLRYTPSDCSETFPFPLNLSSLDDIGERYHTHRQHIMRSRWEGLTKTYNRFHDPKETAEDIARLRELHVEMDHAVTNAYGWDQLDLGHGFHETKQGLRYTISEPARREVLDRLLLLNHERYAEEVLQGLHEKGKGKKKAGRGGKKKAKNEEQEEMEI